MSFTIVLRAGSRPPVSRAASLYASAERCRDCRACLAACPTRPCACATARPACWSTSASTARPASPPARRGRSRMQDADRERGSAVGDRAGGAAGAAGRLRRPLRPGAVLAALRGLGFADVVVTVPATRRRCATRSPRLARRRRRAAPPRRLPGLPGRRQPHRAALPVAGPPSRPVRLAVGGGAERPRAAGARPTSCRARASARRCSPSGRAAAARSLRARRAAAARARSCRGWPEGGARRRGAGGEAVSGSRRREATGRAAPPSAAELEPFGVTGVRHVIAVLEAHRERAARRRRRRRALRLRRRLLRLAAAAPRTPTSPPRRWAAAGRRRSARRPPRPCARAPRPFRPRPGIRLDADMGTAIQKLAQLHEITRRCRAGTAAPAAPPPAPRWPRTSSWSGPRARSARTSPREKEGVGMTLDEIARRARARGAHRRRSPATGDARGRPRLRLGPAQRRAGQRPGGRRAGDAAGAPERRSPWRSHAGLGR